MASSGTMVWAKRSYLQDNTKNYQLALLSTILISLLFMGLQFVAWQQLFASGSVINKDVSTSYLYVISGLHFAHVIGGLPFLGVFLWKAYKKNEATCKCFGLFLWPRKAAKASITHHLLAFLGWALDIFSVIFLH